MPPSPPPDGGGSPARDDPDRDAAPDGPPSRSSQSGPAAEGEPSPEPIEPGTLTPEHVLFVLLGALTALAVLLELVGVV